MIVKEMLALGTKSSTIRELFEYGKRRKAQIGEDKVFDFSLGNPSIPAPKEVADAIGALLEGDPVSLHGYTSAPGDLGVRTVIAENLQKRYGFEADAALTYMTCGAAASLTASLHALAGPGEEVAVLAPYFPEYRVFVEKTGAKLRDVPSLPDSFAIDFTALEQALNEKTAALIVNSPNNPTGVILSEEDLKRLGEMLTKKEKELGHPIYLISDEPYRELVYGGKKTPFPALYYPRTLICYSYSKALSLPGERIGYVSVSPRMPEAKEVFAAVCGAGRSLGFVCAPSLFQQVAGQCDHLLPDLAAYDENRRILTHGLREMGYTTTDPDGAFYLFVKAPGGDARAFSEKAKAHEILVVPSDDFGYPGWVRVSYCVKKETIENSLPAFQALLQDCEN